MLAIFTLTLASGCVVVDPEWVFVSEEFKAPIGRSIDEIYTRMPIKVDDSTTVELRAKVIESSRSTDRVKCLRVLLSFNLQKPASDCQIRIFGNRAMLSVKGVPLKIDERCSKDPGTKLERWQNFAWAAYEVPLDSIALKRDSLGYVSCSIDATLDNVVMNGETPVHIDYLQIYGIKIVKE